MANNLRLDASNSGSNYNFENKIMPANFPRSLFSLSHLNNMSIHDFGCTIPCLLLECVPRDSFELSVNTLLRVLPQVVPLYSQQHLSIHFFYSRLGDLWKRFNTFITKGYNGKTILAVPTLNENISPKFASDSEAVVGNSDLLHYLYDIPIGTKYRDLAGKVSALPLMMYYRIWRDYYMNTNYYLDDQVWLPDADDEFRLDDQSNLISDPDHTLDMTEWLYRDFAPDRFTAAMPSPQRGDSPVLNVSISGDSPIRFVERDTGEVFDFHTSFDSALGTRNDFIVAEDGRTVFDFEHNKSTPYHKMNVGGIPVVDGSYFAHSDGVLNGFVTQNDLRTLAISQAEMERLARTDGSYSQFGLTFFGVSSKNSYDYKPLYIGGTYQPVVFTEVVQTSATTATSALGQYAGHGISQFRDFAGTIDCDDYGYIMALVSVMPDTYYSQGISKMHTRLYQSDFFLPERAKLGAQPVLNQELYFQGTDDDKGLFAYQDIYDELRYVENKVHGKLADPGMLDFFPYTQSRYFDSLPTYSQSFATTKNNVRKDFLASALEVPFTGKFQFGIRAVRPLPYRAVPGGVTL